MWLRLLGEIGGCDGFTRARAFGEDRDFAFYPFATCVDDLGLEDFCGFAVDGRDGCGWAQDDAGGSVEDAADGPRPIGIGEEDFAGALLFGAVVPAAEEGEVVAELGDVDGGLRVGG